MSPAPLTPYTKLTGSVKAELLAKLKKKFTDAATGKSLVRKVEYTRKDVPRGNSLADKNEPLIATALGKDGAAVGKMRIYAQADRILMSKNV